MKKSRVAVLGASPKRDRYSNMAVRRLMEHGYKVIPVNPAYEVIEGLSAVKSLSEIEGEVDTLTIYVNPYLGEKAASDILDLNPGRVIFNPGTETSGLKRKLADRGIPYIEACTLVMLGSGDFDKY